MVWQVRSVQFQPATLDFSSSGQGRYEARQLFFDEELFANAVGLVSWDAPSFQTIVCGSCGIEHCEPGGWLTLRSEGSLRLFIPCFQDWDAARSKESEYAPPGCIARKGAALLDPTTYDGLRAQIPGLPADPPSITPGEVLSLMAFEAPPAVLARDAAGYSVEARALVAVIEGDLESSRSLLETVLDHCRSAQALSVRRLTPGDTAVCFIVDDARFTEWSPIVQTESGKPALLWGNWALEMS